jgi:hypothetical protein
MSTPLRKIYTITPGSDMTEILLTFYRHDKGSDISMPVFPSQTVGEAREAAQMLLSLPEHPPCRIILERTKQPLSDGMTFEILNVQQNDRLILLPPFSVVTTPEPPKVSQVKFSTKIVYTLMLEITPINQHWQYSVELDDVYENSPMRFFADFDSYEEKKFEAALGEVMKDGVQVLQTRKILSQWCEDISQGYRNTSLKVN